MAGLYYFLPDMTRDRLVPKGDRLLDREVLEARGLGDVLNDCQLIDEHVTVSEATTGPDGRSGIVLYPKRTDGELPKVLQYRPEQQTWLPVPHGQEKPLRHIGWLNEQPPQPVDLERRQTYAGYSVKDQNETAWSIPIARSPSAVSGSLPVEYEPDDSGVWKSVLKADFQGLWDLSGEVWDYWNPPDVICGGCKELALDRGPGAVCPNCDHQPMPFDPQRVEKFTDQWQLNAVTAILGVNYRIDRWELLALRRADCNVLDDKFVGNVLLAVIDFDFVTVSKKKEPTDSNPVEPTNCSPGEQEDCQATDQAAAS